MLSTLSMQGMKLPFARNLLCAKTRGGKTRVAETMEKKKNALL